MLLVTGANGHFAGAVIARALELAGDDERIVVTTRDPGSESAQRLAARGVEVRRADFLDPESLTGVFDGVHKALIVSTVGPNDQRYRMHANAIDAAVAADVGHLIYTSFINAGPDAITEHSRLVHHPTEQRLLATDRDVTILRHTVYADAVLDDLDLTFATGEFRRPGGTTAGAYAVRDDLADAAAHVLVHDGHAGRTYTETMQRTHTGDEVAELMSEAFGREIVYRSMPSADWPAYLVDTMGAPLHAAQSSMYTLQAFEQGEFDLVTDDFRTITGRDPQTFPEFLAAQSSRSQ